jgi:hypothetical protein
MRLQVKNYDEFIKVADQYIDDELVRQCKYYPNYGVTESGKVYRLDKKTQLTPNLRGVPEYWYVRTSHGNKAQNVRLHRLIAQAWLPNDDPESKDTVNHIDGDKLNNHISNLEWTTLAKNNQHGCTLEGNFGDSLYNASFTEELVHTLCIRLMGGDKPTDLAEEFNTSRDAINKLKTGSTYFHIRKLYDIPHKFKQDFSFETVNFVCEGINKGVSDINIAKQCPDDNMKVIEVKRIRHKIRFKEISDKFF